jgi:branched-chain amino acid aminotransferase
MAGSQDIAEDPRNDNVLVWLNGKLVPRAQAVVSVFDGGFIAGDGVWEGLRLHHGRWLFRNAHLDRLIAGASTIELDLGLSRDGLAAALDEVAAANDMHDGAHARLMAPRGLKRTPSQDPRQAVGPATIVITAEFKVPSPELATTGLALMTSTYRCTRPDQFDMRLNSHSRLPLILALMQAYRNGADEALMLDDAGHVASCNATNFFIVRHGVLLTSTGDCCFNGITRAAILALCRLHDIPHRICNFSLIEAQSADEAFVTGTFGGVTPIRTLDGRVYPAGTPGPITAKLAALYRAAISETPDALERALPGWNTPSA